MTDERDDVDKPSESSRAPAVGSTKSRKYQLDAIRKRIQARSGTKRDRHVSDEKSRLVSAVNESANILHAELKARAKVSRNRTTPNRGETSAVTNDAELDTGFGRLHLAILDNDFEKVKAAIEAGVAFFPDANGRWPSTLAVLMERSDEICDYVGDEEAKFLGLPV